MAAAADRLAALEGSYSVVVTEGSDLVWAGDLSGIHRLWYRQDAEGVRFASSPASPELVRSPEPSPEGLSAFLFVPDLSDLLGTCAVQGVLPVGPQQMLYVREGRAVLSQRTRPRPEATMEEGAVRLRSALLRAVEHQCAPETRVSFDLSGGLDSSTLTVLAARASQTQAHALTYTDRFACNGDDLFHAERVAQRTPGLKWRLVEGGPGELPFTGLADAPATDTPSLDPLIWKRTRTRLSLAERDGVHLVGDGGDAVLGAPLTYLSELVQPRHGRRFFTEAYALARLRQRPVHRVLRAGLSTARSGFGQAMTVLARQLDPRRATTPPRMPSGELEAGITWLPVDASLSWATDASLAHLTERMQQASTIMGPDQDGVDAHSMRMIQRHAEATRSFIALAQHMDVRVRAPFFDNSVVAACLSVPASERATALSTKPLLNAAMTGLVPAELLDRRTKGDYGSCEYHGLRHNAAALRKLLHEGQLFGLGVVRPEPVLRALELAVVGNRAPMAALQRVLAVELWLRNRRAPLHPARESSLQLIGAMP